MAYTQAELDALKSAYARGVLTITHNGKTITYDSGAAMNRRIKVIEAELNASLAAHRQYPRHQQARFDD